MKALNFKLFSVLKTSHNTIKLTHVLVSFEYHDYNSYMNLISSKDIMSEKIDFLKNIVCMFSRIFSLYPLKHSLTLKSCTFW